MASKLSLWAYKWSHNVSKIKFWGKQKRMLKIPPSNLAKLIQKAIYTRFRGRCFERFLIKSRSPNWSRNITSLEWRVGCILVDFLDICGIDFETCWPLTSEKRRMGKHVKMNTALRRDVHFQGLMGLEIKQKASRNQEFGTTCSRDDLGSQLKGILWG